jgi:hypothetical protein
VTGVGVGSVVSGLSFVDEPFNRVSCTMYLPKPITASREGLKIRLIRTGQSNSPDPPPSLQASSTLNGMTLFEAIY